MTTRLLYDVQVWHPKANAKEGGTWYAVFQEDGLNDRACGSVSDAQEMIRSHLKAIDDPDPDNDYVRNYWPTKQWRIVEVQIITTKKVILNGEGTHIH